MANPTIAPYGTWRSMVDAEMVAGKTLRFGSVAASGGACYWTESRPWDKGRAVIVCREADGTVRDLLPEPYSARSRVHEYGGGEFSLTGKGIFFVNGDDQDVYLLRPDGDIDRITKAPGWRFANIVEDPGRDRLIAVGELHPSEDYGHGHPVNSLVAIALAGDDRGEPVPLAQGADFYAMPAVEPGGTRLAWLEWNLPAMPWDNAVLVVAELDDAGAVIRPDRIAGGDGSAVFQPGWTGRDRLVFTWNPDEFGQPWCYENAELRCLSLREAEFGRPQWSLGMRSWDRLDDGSLVFSVLEKGEFGLLRLTEDDEQPVSPGLRSLENVCCSGDRCFGAATFDDGPPAIVGFAAGEHDSSDGPAELVKIRTAADIPLGPEDISLGECVWLPGDGGQQICGLYYPPKNSRYRGPEDARPPAIVLVHGGPTGYTDRGFKPKIQYWTSRGFAVLDVDFAGSFGYGNRYRRALDRRWGLSDAADLAAAARWLGEQGLADARRIAISGGSSGGYTVLSALVRHDAFAAGVSYYGISDVYRLACTTHKFEAGYIETLTGIAADAPPEAYRELSPLFHASQITVPVLLLQGLEDFVVPPDQSRAIAHALRENGVPVIYRKYEGEGHGFRQSQTLIDSLGHEHAFYNAVFGLGSDEDLPAIDIGEKSGAK